MKVYLALGGNSSMRGFQRAFGAQPPRVLASFAYFPEGLQVPVKAGCDIFIDSGAFTSESSGHPISVHEYGDFLRRWHSKAYASANLDVVQSYRDTARNQAVLEKLGFGVLPVFHWGEPYEVLENLCQQYSYVCCSGTRSVLGDGRGRVMRIDHFTRVFDIAAKYKTRIHGFGVTDIMVMKLFPWFSVDSSSWSRSIRFGAMPLFDPQRGDFINIHTNSPSDVLAQRALLRREYGVAPSQALFTRTSRNELTLLSVRSWLKLEEWINEWKGETLEGEPNWQRYAVARSRQDVRHGDGGSPLAEAGGVQPALDRPGDAQQAG